MLSMLLVSACGAESTPPPATGPSATISAEPPRRSRAPTALRDERLGTAAQGDGLEVGAVAPDARLETIDGGETTLAALFAHGATMLVFYRGGWCPFCSFQVHELSEAYPRFEERGVRLVLVSVDRPEESARTSQAYAIPFPVLSDSDLVAHRAYRVLQVVDDETLAHYHEMGIDLEAASGRDHHTIAIPSIFVIGADGLILFRHVDRDYRTRPSAEQLLRMLDGLRLDAIAPSGP